jgi:hypothetical protein
VVDGLAGWKRSAELTEHANVCHGGLALAAAGDRAGT